MFFIISEDATSCVYRTMYVTFKAKIGKVECPDDIGTDRFWFMCLAPIDVRTSGNTRSIKYVSWFDFI